LFGWDRTLAEISGFGADVLFISYITPCATSAYSLCNKVKSMHPGIITVFGGPHTVVMPMEPFERSQADFVVVGEGEQTSLELIKALLGGADDFNHIDGLYWRQNETIIKNNPRQFIQNLDDIPFPARDLINMKEYNGWFVHRQTPETSILFSRGCPFNCTFCTNSVWKSSKPWLRVRSPQNIADEIEGLREFGIREFFDNSDEFNCNLPHALAVCEEFKKRKLNMSWKSQVRGRP
jgi:anaerobic magnesium-protoporphyrin IX monomethyl ester cyclase